MRINLSPSKKGFNTLIYCVYTHSVEGEIFYVGHGTPTRPYSAGGATNRNKLWIDTVKSSNYFDVDIVGWYDSKASAILKEKELIELHKPYANPPRVYKRSQRKQRIKKVRRTWLDMSCEASA